MQLLLSKKSNIMQFFVSSKMWEHSNRDLMKFSLLI